MFKYILLLLLLPFSVHSAEPKWNEGIKPNGMEEFALWGLTARWIKEENKIRKMCFFYMKRYVTCSNIPLKNIKE